MTPAFAAPARPGRRHGIAALVVLLVTLAGLLGTWSAASAHAELVSTSPTAGAVLPTSPNQVVLTFSESIDAVPDSIRVVAGDGTAVDVGDGPPGRRQGDAGRRRADARRRDVRRRLAGGVGRLPSRRRRRSRSRSGRRPRPIPISSATCSMPTNRRAPPRPWLAIGRWSSYLGLTVMIGVVWVLAGIWPAGLRTRRSTVLLAVAGAVGIAGTALMISAQADENVGSYTAWGEVVDTQSGKWWLIRLIVAAVALVAVLVRTRLRRTTLTLMCRVAGRARPARRRRRRRPRHHRTLGRGRPGRDRRPPRRHGPVGRRARRARVRRAPPPPGARRRRVLPRRAHRRRHAGGQRHAQRLAPVGLVGRPGPQSLRHLADRQAGGRRRRPRAGDGQPVADQPSRRRRRRRRGRCAAPSPPRSSASSS